MRRYGGVAVWAAAVAAVVLGGLVFSSRAPGGELEPSAPPAKSMHTLDEIYANTASVVVPPEALATAGGPVYLWVESIPGGVTERERENWIGVFGFVHDMVMDIVRTPGGASADLVQMAPVVVTKQLDRASPKLALACCKGTHIYEVKIEWPKAERELISRVTLQDVLVTQVTPRLVYRGDGFVLMEDVSFTFNKIKWEYWDATAGRIEAGWNVVTNSEM